MKCFTLIYIPLNSVRVNSKISSFILDYLNDRDLSIIVQYVIKCKCLEVIGNPDVIKILFMCLIIKIFLINYFRRLCYKVYKF